VAPNGEYNGMICVLAVMQAVVTITAATYQQQQRPFNGL